MIDVMIFNSSSPVTICQSQARAHGLILQSDGSHTIAAKRILKGYQPVRTSHKPRYDFTPEAA